MVPLVGPGLQHHVDDEPDDEHLHHLFRDLVVVSDALLVLSNRLLQGLGAVAERPDCLEDTPDVLSVEVLHDEDDDLSFLEELFEFILLGLQADKLPVGEIDELLFVELLKLLVHEVIFLQLRSLHHSEQVKLLRVLLFEALIEDHPLCKPFEPDQLEVMVETVQLDLLDSHQRLLLLIQLVDLVIEVVVDVDGTLLHDVLLLLKREGVVALLDLSLQAHFYFEV